MTIINYSPYSGTGEFAFSSRGAHSSSWQEEKEEEAGKLQISKHCSFYLFICIKISAYLIQIGFACSDAVLMVKILIPRNAPCTGAEGDFPFS